MLEGAKRREGRMKPSTMWDRSHDVSNSYPDQATRVRVVGSGTPWQGVPRGITSVVSRVAVQVKLPSSERSSALRVQSCSYTVHYHWSSASNTSQSFHVSGLDSGPPKRPSPLEVPKASPPSAWSIHLLKCQQNSSTTVVHSPSTSPAPFTIIC